MTTLNRSALRRTSATGLLNKIKESATKKTYEDKDERQWQPTVDQNGNGFAVIRFLPARTEESLPYVKQYNHGFKVNNKWFINLCPTTINEPSPAVEHCNELWNSGLESDKKIARDRKRKLRYFANVLIIKDPKNPENEGKVKIYAFGQKIFEKLMAVINPPEEFGEEPRDPFSFFDGCVVKLKIRNKDGYRNFDETTVDAADDLFDGDEDKLMAILDQLHDIDSLNSRDKFKSYDDLKKELYRVIGDDIASPDSPVRQRVEEQKRPERSTDYNESRGSAAARVATAAVGGAVGASTAKDSESSSDDQDFDADLAMFEDIANGD